MTVAELIEILESMDPDGEVVLATQPSWPFENTISEVTEVGSKVYIGEGSQVGYLPSGVAEELGWH